MCRCIQMCSKTINPDVLSPAQTVLQYTLELVLGFLIPYGVIVVSYICILRRIRQTKFRRRIRSEKLILAIVVTFCVFWLPYHVINMVQVCQTSCFAMGGTTCPRKHSGYSRSCMMMLFYVLRLPGRCVQRAPPRHCEWAHTLLLVVVLVGGGGGGG